MIVLAISKRPFYKSSSPSNYLFHSQPPIRAEQGEEEEEEEEDHTRLGDAVKTLIIILVRDKLNCQTPYPGGIRLYTADSSIYKRRDSPFPSSFPSANSIFSSIAA